MDAETKCRICGATEPKRDPFTNALRSWEVAAPTDAFEGQPLLDYTEVWCSQECRDSDPQYRPFESGADMFGSYHRFAQAHNIDLIGAYAKSRGVSESEARPALERGFDKGLKGLRKAGLQ